MAGEVPDWVVTPAETLSGDVSIDCGLAGTVMRFLPPVAALADGPVAFDGDPQARVRPMGARARRAARPRGRRSTTAAAARCRSPSHGTGRCRAAR